jgi:hypothetical protein
MFRAICELPEVMKRKEYSETTADNEREPQGARKNLRRGDRPAARLCDCSVVGAIKTELPDTRSPSTYPPRRYAKY